MEVMKVEDLKKYIKIQHKLSNELKWVWGLTLFMFIILMIITRKKVDLKVSMAIMSVYYTNLISVWFLILVFISKLPTMIFLRTSRRNYYISSLCYSILVASGFALFQNLLLTIEYMFFRTGNLNEMRIFGVFFEYGTVLGMFELFIFTIIVFYTLLLWANFVSILFYKVGAKVLLPFAGIFIIVLIWCINFMVSAEKNISIWSCTSICLGLSFIFSLLGWKFIRTLSIRV